MQGKDNRCFLRFILMFVVVVIIAAINVPSVLVFLQSGPKGTEPDLLDFGLAFFAAIAVISMSVWSVYGIVRTAGPVQEIRACWVTLVVFISISLVNLMTWLMQKYSYILFQWQELWLEFGVILASVLTVIFLLLRVGMSREKRW